MTTLHGGDIVIDNSLSLGGEIQQHIELNLDGDITIGSSVDVYTGEYEVIPKTISQTLSTTNKLMTQDVLVHEIPYDETSNLYGTTVVIAS